MQYNVGLNIDKTDKIPIVVQNRVCLCCQMQFIYTLLNECVCCRWVGLYLRNKIKHTHRDGFALKLVIL